MPKIIVIYYPCVRNRRVNLHINLLPMYLFCWRFVTMSLKLLLQCMRSFFANLLLRFFFLLLSGFSFPSYTYDHIHTYTGTRIHMCVRSSRFLLTHLSSFSLVLSFVVLLDLTPTFFVAINLDYQLQQGSTHLFHP